MLPIICSVIGVAAITATASLYVKQYKKVEKELAHNPRKYVGKPKTDPGAYLCEIAQKGNIGFLLSEGKLKLLLKEYPLEREYEIKDLFQNVFSPHIKMIGDEDATIGHEIVDYEEIKRDYRDWIKRTSPGSACSLIPSNPREYFVKVETKFDKSVYAAIVCVMYLLFSISDTIGGPFAGEFSFLEEFVCMAAITIFAVVGVVGVRDAFDKLDSLLSAVLLGTVKRVFFVIFALFFCCCTGALLIFTGAGIPMNIMKVYGIVCMILLSLFQKGKLKRKKESKPIDFKERLKPDYIVDGKDLALISDRGELYNQMHMVEKVLWNEKKQS